MPEFITAQDIANCLRISRKRVYELFQIKPEHGGIPNFSVGKSRRVDRVDFEKWLASRKSS